VARLWPLAVAVLVVLPWAGRSMRSRRRPRRLTVNFLNRASQTRWTRIGRHRPCRRGERGRQTFETLLRFDENLVPQPAAAESYDISAVGTVYTFHLRLRPLGAMGTGTAGQFETRGSGLLDQPLNAEYGSFFASAGIRVRERDDDRTFRGSPRRPFGPLPDLAAPCGSARRCDRRGQRQRRRLAADPVDVRRNGPFMVANGSTRTTSRCAQSAYVAHGVGRYRRSARERPDADERQADYAAFLNGERELGARCRTLSSNAALNVPTSRDGTPGDGPDDVLDPDSTCRVRR